MLNLLILFLGLSLVLSTLSTDTSVASVGASHPKLAVSVGLFDRGDGSGSDLELSRRNGEGGLDINLLGARDVLGVTLLGLAGTAREQDEASLVLFEALNVELESLDAAVLTTEINGDADGVGKLAGNLGSLQLLKSETTASTLATVVALGGAANDGAKSLQRTGGNAGGLFSTSGTARSLLASLVEMNANALLPVLAEVVLKDGVILGNSHWRDDSFTGLSGSIHEWKCQGSCPMYLVSVFSWVARMDKSLDL